MAANSTVRPKLADIYFDWGAEGRAATTPSLGGIVAVVATSNWGPVNTVVPIGSETKLYDPKTGFGDSDTDLHRVSRDAFKGQGFNGKGGASAVLGYRQATAAAARGTRTLQNTTPATALTLVGRWPGSRINTFKVTVQAGAVAGTNELLILDGALVVERYPHPTTDIAKLASDINRLSDWFTVDPAAVVTGTALATVANAAVSGGLDGAAVTGAEWTATFAALDRQRWALVAPYGLTDTTIRAALIAWIKGRNALGARSWAVLGGVTGESLSVGVARSQAINNENVLNIGRGTLHLVDENRDVSTAQFVGRYAGARAWRGETRDDFFVRFAGVDIVDGPTLTDEATALDGGLIVFSRDTYADAPVYIREGVTTYSDDSQSPLDDDGHKLRPVDLLRRIKNIAIQHGVENEVGDWARSGEIIGDQPVDDKTREMVLGRYRIAYSTRQEARVVQPSWTVQVAGDPDDDDDFIECLHGFHPTRSLRQLLNVSRVG